VACLAPCPACQRHVSTHETACPFCAAALPESLRCRPARGTTPGRLGRAARLAAGAALLSASCGAAVAAYGVAIIPDAGADTSGSDGNNDDAAAAPLARGDSTPAPKPNKN